MRYFGEKATVYRLYLLKAQHSLRSLGQQPAAILAGFEILLEIQWETMTNEGGADQYDENWTKIYFRPLIVALKDITRDAMGQEALRTGLKKVVIGNSSNNTSEDAWTRISQGVLHLDYVADRYADYIDSRSKSLIEVLEKAL
jgi:hypothetical protein